MKVTVDNLCKVNNFSNTFNIKNFPNKNEFQNNFFRHKFQISSWEFPLYSRQETTRKSIISTE